MPLGIYEVHYRYKHEARWWLWSYENTIQEAEDEAATMMDETRIIRLVNYDANEHIVIRQEGRDVQG